MIPYSTRFAEIYDEDWSSFASRKAPKVLDLFRNHHRSPEKAVVLDLCCGTGQMAENFLEQGCIVTGIDQSQAMLDRAVARCSPYVKSGAANFLRANACDFLLGESVDFCVSAYDALNHLPDEESLWRCLDAVFRALAPHGLFVFDLKTEQGMRGWNSISITEKPQWTLITRGAYDDKDTAHRRVTGFVQDDDGRFTRFEETMTERWFDPESVCQRLEETGWCEVRYALSADLTRPITGVPQDSSRVYIVAERGAQP
ncbi:class I SAM-dependent methyltransferase [Streptomyces sp. PmtG]